MFIHVLNEFLFWVLVLLLLYQAYTLVFNKGVPNIHTAPAIRRRIIEIIRADMAAKNKKPYTIMDMGSGNGMFTRQLARTFPEARVIGLEFSEHTVKWCNFLKRLYKLDNLQYVNTDFFKYDMSEADAVVLYLVAALMESIGKKLHHDLKLGTLVSSNKFLLGDGWKPDEVIEVQTRYPHQKWLHIYRQK